MSQLEKDRAQDKELIVQLTSSLRADEQLQQSTRDEMSALTSNFERFSSDVTRVDNSSIVDRIQVLAGQMRCRNGWTRTKEAVCYHFGEE